VPQRVSRACRISHCGDFIIRIFGDADGVVPVSSGRDAPILSEWCEPLVQDRTPRRAIVLDMLGAAAPYRASGLVHWRKADLRRFEIQLDARLNILHHTGERQAMECAAICFNVCIAAVLLIFAPAKSPQRDVQL
jgi:hypothetical protein